MALNLRITSKFIVSAAVFALATFGIAPPAVAKGDSVAAAKQRVADAQKAANQAAKNLADAEGKYLGLSNEIAAIEDDITNNQTKAAGLKDVAAQRGVEAYVSAYKDGSNIPTDILEVERRDVFLETANGDDRDEVNELGAVTEDLADQKTKLNAQREEQKAALATIKAQQTALKVKLEQARAAQVKLEAQQKRKRSYGGNGRGAYAGPAFVITPGSGTFICPIAGAMAHTNDWGNPRSGGRSHKGNDLFAARGVPNVAVAAGQLSFGSSRLGGTDAYISTDSGVAYFYAHLDRTVGSPRRVAQGEVIGTTGNSGNTRGGATHTHFEIRVGGLNGTRVNPYPTVRGACGG